MKITKNQLRRIIKEEKAKILKEQVDHYEWRHQEDQLGLEDHQADVVLEIIQDDEGLPGREVVARALRNSVFGGLQASDVYKALDILVADGDVALSTEEDAWYVTNSREHAASIRSAEYHQDIHSSEITDAKNEGASLDDMPTAWKQVLGSCLGKD